ncbi:hypothetical protein M413DRAFT_421938 [Hebeloma cylindrosporum]|uniref:RTA1 like protein n=1 Tax=Hebeloma cylindrosporum TaxID=76867 RepID=A0A0C2Z0G5_HEBCY|nr:hypothetical protein M413DRAFT_421938 [Hebeloma cylindrosporum h7]
MTVLTAEELYGYNPSRVTAMVFVIAFGGSFFLHTGQAIGFHMRWLLSSLAMCALMEASGWGGRVWSTYVPSSVMAFSLQNGNTLLAPGNLLIANFRIFGEIMNILGTSYSPLTPKQYKLVFNILNGLGLVMLVLGGVVSTAVKTPLGQSAGHGIVLGGMVAQLVVIIAFVGYVVDYLVRYHNDSPASKEAVRGRISTFADSPARGRYTGKLKTMTYALAFVNACLFIRTIYRLAALSDSPTGGVIHNELDLSVFDGALMLLALHALNVFHPGALLSTPKTEERSPV